MLGEPGGAEKWIPALRRESEEARLEIYAIRRTPTGLNLKKGRVHR